MSDSNPKAFDSERRRLRRRPILETFSVFAVLPEKGPYRLDVHDVSEGGMGFNIDIEEDAGKIPLVQNEELEIHFYLNQSLNIPLKVRVAYLEEKTSVRRVGGEFVDKQSPSYQAFLSFVELLDRLGDLG